ncbi:ketoisovalerate oxidoreductase subunit VorA (VOR) (2-oxoisovalerate oxidoreductase alpha chain) (2-oxoisovalerateferredoxin reductase subunit alpha) [Treponema primitia ZAS-2]|uniref:Ketoisovalerate oxidoreductase subunit VorA (VOR) (2-oxoisovalerate oxidoreductase alpha chain) (2-oxoisovalerateferredoxin reductase subunit alpha) n=1 Tax=Treponema primitia (strain ATCC BAA-887 / DSM 12427 / ZAS-2) TaxID=545694 RepID=F5YJJ8_TREPZ|nr:2-oxoacid:acceptor oxidoreductase family protein [Treponema primitia]AEF84370.1 ketoisovalerate oxidoreductase subunit VorA (VOR) (2-oxoisovalerate oxidoreductase alpha chain) (2-oxoisovalerateferredoxin reductase subunit alpha) [Treponema primitia ZAS-2]
MTEKSFFAGFGGQGIISLGQIWAYCALKEGKNVTFFPFYGAEKRGGIARAGVVVSDEEIDSPLVTTPDSVLVMNADSLPLCEGNLKPGGLMLINSSLVKDAPKRSDIRLFTADLQALAEKIGHSRYTNMVALGAMAKLTGILNVEGIEPILKKFFPEDKHKFLPMNIAAIQAGFGAV